MSDVIEWDQLNEGERAAVKLISESGYLSFLRIWFQINQGQKFKVNWHHRYVGWIVERIINGVERNVILNLPPGSGKTEMISIGLPLYARVKSYTEKNRCRFMQLSFSDSLTKRNSIRCRDAIASDEWQWCWPSEFETQQVEEWRLLNSKNKVDYEMVSRSTGGQITGGRGGYFGEGFTGMINLDDPAKPLDMFSKVKRDRINDIMVNTIRSRRGDKSKETPTPILFVMQRLHVQDPCWFAESGGMAIDFNTYKVPALIDEDYIESLPDEIREHCIADVCESKQVDGQWSFWPDVEDIDQLIALKDKNEYTFASQYMQAPFAIGGNAIKAEWFLYYEDNPDVDSENLETPYIYEYRFITADTAQKTNEWNDFSVICLWGYFEGKVYLIDMIRGKWEAPELRERFTVFVTHAFTTNVTDGSLRTAYVEDKSSGTGLIQDLSNELPVYITPVQRNKDKRVRCMDAEPQIKKGRVVLPAGEKFSSDVVYECAAFTYDDSHDHDDICDNVFDAVDIAINEDSSVDLSFRL